MSVNASYHYHTDVVYMFMVIMNVGKHLSHFQDIHEFLRLQYICIDVKTCSRDCEFLNLCAIFLFNNFMYPVSS